MKNTSFLRIFVGLLLTVLLVCTFITLLILQKNNVLTIQQAILSFVFLVLLFGCFLIPILRSLKHNTAEDIKREDELLNSLVGVKKLKYIHRHSFLGKCFLGAVVFAFLLQLLIKLPFIQKIPFKNLETVIRALGLIIVLSFVILMYFYNKKMN